MPRDVTKLLLDAWWFEYPDHYLSYYDDDFDHDGERMLRTLKRREPDRYNTLRLLIRGTYIPYTETGRLTTRR